MPRDDNLRPSDAALARTRTWLESLSDEQAEEEMRRAAREARKRDAGRKGLN